MAVLLAGLIAGWLFVRRQRTLTTPLIDVELFKRYALWYLWIIRHLDGAPYITPIFVPEFKWVEAPDAVIWPDKAEE